MQDEREQKKKNPAEIEPCLSRKKNTAHFGVLI